MIADKIVEVAKRYIGQTEKPNNSGFTDALFEQRMKDTGWSKGASRCIVTGKQIGRAHV